MKGETEQPELKEVDDSPTGLTTAPIRGMQRSMGVHLRRIHRVEFKGDCGRGRPSRSRHFGGCDASGL